MSVKIENTEINNNQTEVETTKSIDGHFEISDEFDFDYGDEQPSQTKAISENVIRKPNNIRENEADIRAATQAAFEKYGPVIVVIVNDKSHSVVVEKKETASATKRELKTCVKAFFWIAGVSVIAALIISWMY